MSAPTPDAIGELRQLAMAATRGGPWCTRGRSVYLDHWHVMPRVAEADMKVDADWIAAVSPTAGLVLLAEIDRLRAEMAAAQEREARVQRRFFDECETAGWDPAKRNSFAEECAHLHEEVSEAFREWRLHKNFEIRYGNDGKPTGIPIELADVLIGLFYNAELHGFDLMAATEIKHRWNLTRRYQDEGRTLHPIAALADPAPSGETP